MGYSGDDKLFGSVGEDDLLGGWGADEITGGVDNDHLYGGNYFQDHNGLPFNTFDGSDKFWGGDGDDIIETHHFPEADDDPNFVAPAVPDYVSCGSGVDTVYQADPSDTIEGDCEVVFWRQEP